MIECRQHFKKKVTWRLHGFFLDVDGVLNRKADWVRPFSLTPSCVQVFVQLVRKLEKSGTVDIVLSSSWRAGLAKGSYGTLLAGTGDILGKTLQTYGLKISDVTPISNKTRQEEIECLTRCRCPEAKAVVLSGKVQRAKRKLTLDDKFVIENYCGRKYADVVFGIERLYIRSQCMENAIVTAQLMHYINEDYEVIPENAISK